MNYLELMLTMQDFNLHKQFDKAKLVYEKYSSLIPKYDIYLQNKFLNEYEIACKKFILESKPRNLQIVLFDKCSSNCIMCVQKNKKYNNYYLPERYIEELGTLLPYIDTITWQGGEVFLWDKFVYMIDTISKYKQITQSVVTNFQTITEEQIKYLAQITNLKLIISIDGSEKEIYEKIRVGSSFNKLIENIKILNKYISKYRTNISKHINFVVLKGNIKNIVDMISVADKYGFESISYKKCCDTKSYVDNITNVENLNVNKLLNFATIQAVKKNIKISILYPSLIVNNIRNKNIKLDTLACKLPWYKLVLVEDFSFAPECVCFKRFDYYSKNISMQQMWNSKLMQDYRKNIFGIRNNLKICNSSCLYYAAHYIEGIGTNKI